MSNSVVKNNNFSEIITVLISAGFMLFFRFIPPIAPITPYGMAILGIFIGVMFGWCFTKTTTLWPSLLALFALGVTLPTGSFGAMSTVFTNYVFLILILVMFQVGALTSSGLAEYLVFKFLNAPICKGRPWVFLAMVFFGAWAVCFVINAILVTIFLFSLYTTLFEQVGYKRGDKAPVLILISTSVLLLMNILVLPWGSPQLVVIQMLQAAGIVVPTGKYMLLMVICSFLVIFVLLGMLKLMKCDVEKLGNADLSELEAKYKNGLTRHQKGVLVAVTILTIELLIVTLYPQNGSAIANFITNQVGLIGVNLVVVVLMLIIKIDGKLLLDPKEMASSFAWDTLMLIGVGVTMGTMVTAAETGVSAWVSDVLGPIFIGRSEFFLLALLCVTGLILTNFLNNNAITILLATVVITLFGQGFISNPIAASVVVLLGACFGILTPAASMYGAMMHGHAFGDAKLLYKYGLIMLGVCLVYCMVVVVPLVTIIF